MQKHKKKKKTGQNKQRIPQLLTKSYFVFLLSLFAPRVAAVFLQCFQLCLQTLFIDIFHHLHRAFLFREHRFFGFERLFGLLIGHNLVLDLCVCVWIDTKDKREKVLGGERKNVN